MPAGFFWVAHRQSVFWISWVVWIFWVKILVDRLISYWWVLLLISYKCYNKFSYDCLESHRIQLCLYEESRIEKVFLSTHSQNYAQVLRTSYFMIMYYSRTQVKLWFANQATYRLVNPCMVGRWLTAESCRKSRTCRWPRTCRGRAQTRGSRSCIGTWKIPVVVCVEPCFKSRINFVTRRLTTLLV